MGIELFEAMARGSVRGSKLMYIIYLWYVYKRE